MNDNHIDGSADELADLKDRYREMASDETHEREAEEWIEGLIGDAIED